LEIGVCLARQWGHILVPPTLRQRETEMPKWSKQPGPVIGCKGRAGSRAKEIPDVENVESVKRKCRSHWRGLGCSYRPEKRKPTIFWGRPEKGAISNPGCWDRHLLATVPDSPLLFKSSSFLCCCGVRSL